MKHQERLFRLLREANPIPDAHDRYENSDQARALSLLVEERRHGVPAPSNRDRNPTPPPRKPSARRSVLAFAGAAAATMIALALVAVFPFGDGGGNVGGGVETGTISISVRGWSGVEGYRLLASVWTEDYDPDDPQTGPLVGGAFWTIIDSDPFSGEDVVHPPAIPNPRSEARSWGAEDYLWAETAELDPGLYRIDFWANPGELTPYGSHIPASPIERHCSVDVEVKAGESTLVVITGIPRDGPCSEAEPASYLGWGGKSPVVGSLPGGE